MSIHTLDVEAMLSTTAVQDAMEKYRQEYQSEPAFLLVTPSDYWPACEMVEGGPIVPIAIPTMPRDHWLIVGPEGIVGSGL